MLGVAIVSTFANLMRSFYVFLNRQTSANIFSLFCQRFERRRQQQDYENINGGFVHVRRMVRPEHSRDCWLLVLFPKLYSVTYHCTTTLQGSQNTFCLDLTSVDQSAPDNKYLYFVNTSMTVTQP